MRGSAALSVQSLLLGSVERAPSGLVVTGWEGTSLTRGATTAGAGERLGIHFAST